MSGSRGVVNLFWLTQFADHHKAVAILTEKGCQGCVGGVNFLGGVSLGVFP
jgi:hypothetical protein